MNILVYATHQHEDEQYMNEAGKVSIEAGLKMKDSNKDVVVTAITVGVNCEDALYEAYGMGVDQAALLVGEETSANIACMIKKIPYDMIFINDEIGAAVAEELNVSSIEYKEETMKTAAKPCVVLMKENMLTARYMNIANVFSAYDKKIVQLSL